MPEVEFNPPQHWRKVLEQVVARLNVGDDGSTCLWDVLTALRGPDTRDPILYLKLSTTAVIREQIGLIRDSGVPALIRADSDIAVQTRVSLLEKQIWPSSHFYGHARRAFRALGLQWSTLNPAKEREEKTITTKSQLIFSII